DQSFHDALQSLRILLQVRPFDEHRHTHRRQSGLLALAEHGKSLLGEPAAQIDRHHRGIDQTAFERLAENRYVADDDHLNVVALLVHAEMLQPDGGGFPHAAAAALNPETLAAQILRAVDAGPRHEIEILAAAEAGDDFHVLSAHS